MTAIHPFGERTCPPLPPLFAESQMLGILIMVALGMIIAMVMLRTYRNFRRQKKDDKAFLKALKPKRTDRGHHLDAPGEVLRWEVQMHETARELSAQLDSKMSALQTLIADADRAAARMEAAAAGPSASEQSTEPDPRLSSQDLNQQICTLSDYGFNPAEIARRVGSTVGEVELILGQRYQK